jgi:hypothetical protein
VLRVCRVALFEDTVVRAVLGDSIPFIMDHGRIIDASDSARNIK